jgi:hypothetical protein
MAITYAWEITNLRKANTLNTLENVVVHVRWKKVGTDENGTTGEFAGATPLTAPDSDFTPYEELTKEQVLGWIQNIVVGSYEQHVNEQIEKQIIKKNDPWVDVTETPWGQNFQNVSPITEQPAVE